MKKTPFKAKTNFKKSSGLNRSALKPKSSTSSKPKNTTKKSSVNSLIKKCDRLFSLWVRAKAADKMGNVRCYTCGKKGKWKYSQMQCGHYRGRGNMNTRWDEENAKVQCKHCNQVLNGNYQVYRMNLIKERGEANVVELEQRSRKVLSLTDGLLLALKEQLQTNLDNIIKEKGL